MQREKSGKISLVGKRNAWTWRFSAIRGFWQQGQEIPGYGCALCPKIASAILLSSIGFQPKRGNVIPEDSTH